MTNLATRCSSSKYHNKPVNYDGFTFDSQAERARYCELLLLEKAGQIEHLEVHPRFVLQYGFTGASGIKYRTLVYEADFQYIEDGKAIVEDVKGYATREWRIKVMLFEMKFPDLKLRVTNV